MIVIGIPKIDETNIHKQEEGELIVSEIYSFFFQECLSKYF